MGFFFNNSKCRRCRFNGLEQMGRAVLEQMDGGKPWDFLSVFIDASSVAGQMMDGRREDLNKKRILLEFEQLMYFIMGEADDDDGTPDAKMQLDDFIKLLKECHRKK